MPCKAIIYEIQTDLGTKKISIKTRHQITKSVKKNYVIFSAFCIQYQTKQKVVCLCVSVLSSLCSA